MSTKTKLPNWFNGELYKEGGTVRNRFSGEEYELNNIELSMYDFIMGAQMFGNMSDKMIDDVQKALSWFRKHNPKAYMVLLD